MNRSIEAMRRFNIIGMVSGEPDQVATWRAAAPDRIIPGLDLRLPGTPGQPHVKARTPAEIRALHLRGQVGVLGEIMAQYEGVSPADPRLEPYWALAEELDIPVAIHMGPGDPAGPYGNSGYRASLGNPLLLEDVLVRHPRMRLYIMHAAYPLSDDLRALMFSHPQVYVDVGIIAYVEPRAAFHAFLKELVDAGFADRIMFGSDQMIWPGVIEPAIRSIEHAPFLTDEQKRDIFYNNAARFLRLSTEQIADHHRR
jgi:predicted TIM-barrel fold metal-dependent hydrolase